MCVCLCVFAIRGSVFCRFVTKISTLILGAEGKVRLKMYNIIPSRGVDPRVKCFDDADATHSSLFQHTPAPFVCRLYGSLSFAKLRAIKYSLPMEHYSYSAFVSLQILIAFAPNPTYTFSAASATRRVCLFLSKQARRARFQFDHHIRDRATRLYLTCPLHIFCPYTMQYPVRTKDGPCI